MSKEGFQNWKLQTEFATSSFGSLLIADHNSGAWIFTAAIPAQSKERKMVRLYCEPLLAPDSGEQTFYRLVRNFFDLAARLADQMMVGLIARDFVDHAPAAQIRREDQSQLVEKIQGTVHGGPVDRRRFRVHPLVNLLGRGVALAFADRVQNQLALRGHAEAVPPHQCFVIAVLMGHIFIATIRNNK